MVAVRHGHKHGTRDSSLLALSIVSSVDRFMQYVPDSSTALWAPEGQTLRLLCSPLLFVVSDPVVGRLGIFTERMSTEVAKLLSLPSFLFTSASERT